MLNLKKNDRPSCNIGIRYEKVASSRPLELTLHHSSGLFPQAGETALDKAREHNNPEVALLLTKAPQVKPKHKSEYVTYV